MKMTLTRQMKVVNCPKHKRIVPVGRVGVKDDPVNCRKCSLYVKELCNYLRCQYTEP